MLKNRIYRGEIVHKEQHYPGEHDPIIDETLWQEVQAKLAINAVERGTGEKAANPSLLAGLLYDGQGHRMTPSHAVKKGMRYRYYVSQSLIGKSREASPEGLRIAAAEIEGLVLSGIGELIADPGGLADTLGACIETAGEQQRMLQRAAGIAMTWADLPATQLRAIVPKLVQRITVARERVDIEISRRGLCRFLSGEPGGTELAGTEDDHPLLLSFSMRLCRIGQGKRLVIDAAARPGIPGKPDSNLTKLLVRAHRLKEKLRGNPGARVADLAMTEKLSPSYAAMLLRLTFLAPDITRAILEGRQPSGFTAQRLVTHAALPLAWPDQRQALGFA